MAPDPEPEAGNSSAVNANDNASATHNDEADTSPDASGNAGVAYAGADVQVNATDNVDSEAQRQSAEVDDTEHANVKATDAELVNSPPQNSQAAVAKPAATPTPNPDLDKRVPLTYWLVCGGIGPPPKMRNFLRMASERNAVARAQKARAAARKQALEERKQYLTDWEKEWGPVGAARLVCKLLGSNRRKKT
ncbi:hypothetical protein F5Y06DRAFT_307969 [Hypoxylon sp. FL0890]|nr:hypothetical protein F5Y06DRAFT_307969 [Hypoxylon sp. FL0890]